MASFSELGGKLIANGYLILPIQPGEKRPALRHWSTARLAASDLPRYPESGAGILTGQGAYPVVGIDIDTLHEPLALAFRDWCLKNLGDAPERIGQAPKRLLVYGASEDGWPKLTGAWHEGQDDRHRVEILGKGQQFVAYHVHPDTHEPYEWVDLMGGIADWPASDLKVVTQDQLEAALEAFERLAAEHGLTKATNAGTNTLPALDTDNDNALANAAPPVGLTLDQARSYLRHVSSHDYDTWLRVGMSLHHEFSGSDAARELWDAWSSDAPSYHPDAISKRWPGFAKSDGPPITIRWLIKYAKQQRTEAERAITRDVLDKAEAQIAACDDSLKLLDEIAPKAGTQIGDNAAARTELLGTLRERFKTLTGTPLTMSEARRALDRDAHREKTAATVQRTRRERTEFGNAERMLDHYGDGLMYVPELDQWYRWTEVYWQRAARVEIEHWAKETIRALPNELKEMASDGEREAFLKFCAASQRAHMVRSMVQLAQSDPRVVVPVSQLDKDTNLLGVANGVVDLTTGELFDPAPEHCITLSCPVEYDPGADAPLWHQTVADVFFDDEDQVEFFQRLIGYSLLGQPKEDILAIPYGNGCNGKSTVLGVIRDILGPYARMAQSETFLANGGGPATNPGGAREDVLRLRAARFVYVTEPEENSELKEGMVKSMTGGESLPARGLWAKTTIEVDPTWVVFMPTNHKPIVKGDDYAIWRRLLPIPFTRNFDGDPITSKDPDRPHKLWAEAPGILRWCVEGVHKYLEQGLHPPRPVKSAREEYKSDMDLLGDWLEECCEQSPDYKEATSQLWASWEAYARARGELRLISSSRSLGRRLASRFNTCRLSGGVRGFRGVRVKKIGDFG